MDTELKRITRSNFFPFIIIFLLFWNTNGTTTNNPLELLAKLQKTVYMFNYMLTLFVLFSSFHYVLNTYKHP